MLPQKVLVFLLLLLLLLLLLFVCFLFFFFMEFQLIDPYLLTSLCCSGMKTRFSHNCQMLKHSCIELYSPVPPPPPPPPPLNRAVLSLFLKVHFIEIEKPGFTSFVIWGSSHNRKHTHVAHYELDYKEETEFTVIIKILHSWQFLPKKY